MGTTTKARAAASFPAYVGLGAGNLSVAYGYHDFAANPTAADIIELCKVPKGAVVLDGFYSLEDIDSNATEEVDIDVGYAANGDVVADPDAFGNFGVVTGDAVAGYTPEAGTRMPLRGVLSNGPLTLTADTVITATVNVDAATFAAGTLYVCVYYVNP